jgi:hypothetical protein
MAKPYEWRENPPLLLPPEQWECGGDPDCPTCRALDAAYDVPPERQQKKEE